MADWIALCPLSALPEGHSKSVDIHTNSQPLALVLVHKNGKIVGYHNQCPHLGIRLEWQPDQFLDIDGYFIQCASHAALFNIHDGHCIAGPCVGRYLDAISIDIRDGMIGMQLP